MSSAESPWPSVCHRDHKHQALARLWAAGLIPRGVKAAATKSFLGLPGLQVPLGQQGRRTSQGATRAARGQGRRVAQAAKARGRAAGKAKARRRRPQQALRQGRRTLPSAASAPASER